jgi:hypothetical protein
MAKRIKSIGKNQSCLLLSINHSAAGAGGLQSQGIQGWSREAVAKPPLGPNPYVAVSHSILKILKVFLRLNGSLRLDIEPD